MIKRRRIQTFELTQPTAKLRLVFGKKNSYSSNILVFLSFFIFLLSKSQNTPVYMVSEPKKCPKKSERNGEKKWRFGTEWRKMDTSENRNGGSKNGCFGTEYPEKSHSVPRLNDSTVSINALPVTSSDLINSIV